MARVRHSTLHALLLLCLAGCHTLREECNTPNLSQQAHRHAFRYHNIGAKYQPSATRKDWLKHGLKLCFARYPGREGLPEDMALNPDEADRQFRKIQTRPTSLTWFGHNTFLIRLGGKAILTDPVLDRRIGPDPLSIPRLVPAMPDWRMIERLDAILITHGDYDHLDTGSLAMLVRTFPHVSIYVPEGTKHYLKRVSRARIIEMKWYDETQLGAVDLAFVPAIHGTRRPPYKINSAHWGGFILSMGRKKLYLTGDIAQGTVYRQIARRYGPIHTVITPIGGYAPQWFNRAFHALPHQNVAIARLMNAREVIAAHWGTFALSEDSGKMQKRAFLQERKKMAHGPKRTVMQIGQSRTLW